MSKFVFYTLNNTDKLAIIRAIAIEKGINTSQLPVANH